jgi:hypothetical protein
MPYIYNTTIAATEQDARWRETLWLLGGMEKIGLALNVIAYTASILALVSMLSCCFYQLTRLTSRATVGSLLLCPMQPLVFFRSSRWI